MESHDKPWEAMQQIMTNYKTLWKWDPSGWDLEVWDGLLHAGPPSSSDGSCREILRRCLVLLPPFQDEEANPKGTKA